jgi:Protein of unknown function (DUF2569)
MDQEKVDRFAEGYRQMRDEKLASLLVTSDSLTEEAKSALFDVIAERPGLADIIRQGEERAARAASTISSERPSLGFWLGFLTFGLCVAPIRTAVSAYGEIRAAEQQTPVILEWVTWQAYKVIATGLCISVLVAAIVAIHAIHAGRTRRHLQRIVAMLWYIALGAVALDFLAAGLLFGFVNSALVFADPGFVGQILVGVFFTSLWTAYLLLSARCRDRYPRTAPDGQIVQAFD